MHYIAQVRFTWSHRSGTNSVGFMSMSKWGCMAHARPINRTYNESPAQTVQVIPILRTSNKNVTQCRGQLKVGKQGRDDIENK